MKKTKAPFSVHKRPTKGKGKFVYYAQFRDQNGTYTSAVSTGQSSKGAATSWAWEYLKKGHVPVRRGYTFERFSEKWWLWGECGYIKGKLARGMPMSARYAEESRRNLENHLLPYFGDSKLTSITPNDIEEWVLNLYSDSGLSPATINRILSTLKVMLGQAEKLGYVAENPARRIGVLKERPRSRSILTIHEVRALFREDRIQETWRGDQTHFTLNLLAASTGMRMGEIQGLQVGNVHGDSVEIGQAWSRRYGLKSPKWRSERVVPIPSKTAKHLRRLIGGFVNTQDDSLVFSAHRANTPIDHKTILERLYGAFSRIGIDEAQRRERNVTFHSWRHFFNSICRAKVPDSILQRVTGHRTREMVDLYTHFSLQDFSEVVAVQEGLFAETT